MNSGEREQNSLQKTLGFLSPSECPTLEYFFLLFILVDSEFGCTALPSECIV